MKRPDIILLISMFLLSCFGLLMIYDASSVIAYRDFQDKYHYIKDQMVWTVLGYVALTFFSFFNYRKFYFLALPLLLTAIALLVLVFIPGIGVNALGASRWVNLGFFGFQPAEFVKLSLAIYLAAWFSAKEKERFMAFCMLLGLVLLLVMAQPDMGTASIILFEAFVIYFLSGGSIRHFFAIIPAIGVVGFVLILMAPYRLARLTAFLKVNDSLHESSYHVKQILIALGSGGIFGVGLGNSLQKYAYLPENVTDSIFAIIAEEFGLFGSCLLIMLFMLIIWRGFYIASHVKDTFGKLLASGIITFIGIQMAINLAAMSALVPLTGVPLPFISYGGSALIVDMTAIGILLNISRHIEKRK